MKNQELKNILKEIEKEGLNSFLDLQKILFYFDAEIVDVEFDGHRGKFSSFEELKDLLINAISKPYYHETKFMIIIKTNEGEKIKIKVDLEDAFETYIHLFGELTPNYEYNYKGTAIRWLGAFGGNNHVKKLNLKECLNFEFKNLGYERCAEFYSTSNIEVLKTLIKERYMHAKIGFAYYGQSISEVYDSDLWSDRLGNYCVPFLKSWSCTQGVFIHPDNCYLRKEKTSFDNNEPKKDARDLILSLVDYELNNYQFREKIKFDNYSEMDNFIDKMEEILSEENFKIFDEVKRLEKFLDKPNLLISEIMKFERRWEKKIAEDMMFQGGEKEIKIVDNSLSPYSTGHNEAFIKLGQKPFGIVIKNGCSERAKKIAEKFASKNDLQIIYA